ncbi:hypothetical protein [Escherichia coli]|uniref:hypothetical protein n=1 Tax=Escherichia coli TaxID=562 RepID=UPI0031332A0A
MKKYTIAIFLCLITTASAATQYVFVPGSGTATSDMDYMGQRKVISDAGDRDFYLADTLTTDTLGGYTVEFDERTAIYTSGSGFTPSKPATGAHVIQHGTNNDVHVEYIGETAHNQGAQSLNIEPNESILVEGYCELPQSIETDANLGNETVTFGYQMYTRLNNRPLTARYLSVRTTCSGTYKRWLPINLSVHPNNLQLTGSSMTQLTGTSEITLTGATANVLVEIVNPNTTAITVSLSQTEEVLNTIIPLASEQDVQYRKLYVTAKPTGPGHKEYRVNINASYI